MRSTIFQLVRNKNKDCWTLWKQEFKTMQDFIKKYQQTAIPNKMKEKVMLDGAASTDIVTVSDTYYTGNEDYYTDYNDEEDPEYVEDVEDDPSEYVKGAQVICVEEFRPEADQGDSCLPISKGDVLVITNKYIPSEDWVLVRGANKQRGYVPFENIKIKK